MFRPILACLPALALIACGGSPTDPVESAESSAAGRSSGQEPAVESVDSSPDYTALLEALGPEYATASVSSGARQFRRCQACHQITPGGRNMVGPNLFGVMGQPAGQVERFNYSQQLLDSGLTWDAATMDAWLASPRAVIPGNRMSFVGLRDAEDRRDLIAFLAAQSGD
jgi:cytochrome c